MKKIMIVLCAASLIVQTGIVKSQNLNVSLAAQLTYPGQSLANIWGWKSPVDGKEYALVGAQNGLSIVDVTNPSAPVEIVQIPGPSSTWREVKTVGNYAYITTENGKIGLQIVELTNLPGANLADTTWTPQIGMDTLKKIHALHADGGKIYLYGSNVGNKGCIIADVSATPMNPVYLGSYDPQYVHDGYVRNDTLYAGHIYAGEVAVVDVSNAASPALLATFKTPNSFTHNTWLSQDSKTCFTTDEVSNSFLTSFDISDLSNISEWDKIQSNPGSNSVVHNTHILQKNGADYAVTSWYKDGITIVDASRPGNLVQVGNYDTSPMSGSGYDGCWGVYPFLPSGTILASDMQEGLFVLTPAYTRACYLEGIVTDCASGSPIMGVNAEIQIPSPASSSHFDATDSQGKYAAGTAAPGAYNVIFSKTGYIIDTVSVILYTDSVVIQNVQLCQLPEFTFTGKIYDNASSLGIPGTNVRVRDTVNTWESVTDTAGNFSIAKLYKGDFEIIAGKWGHITQCVNQNITAVSPPLSMGLDKGIYDDFTWDWGWTVNSTTKIGKWERGEPLGTDLGGGLFFNPDEDVSSDCSVEAYVTGNKDMPDSGVTILTSPEFDLTGYTNPRLYCSLWRVILMAQGSPPADTVQIIISNGSTKATLLSTSVENFQGQWSIVPKNINSFLSLTSTMKLMVRVLDYSSQDWVFVEAGFDKFYIQEMSGAVVSENKSGSAHLLLYPNPFSNHASLVITNKSELNITGMELRIYDLMGKEVNAGAVRNADGFLLDRKHLSSGMYFYVLFMQTDNGPLISTEKMMIE